MTDQIADPNPERTPGEELYSRETMEPYLYQELLALRENKDMALRHDASTAPEDTELQKLAAITADFIDSKGTLIEPVKASRKNCSDMLDPKYFEYYSGSRRIQAGIIMARTIRNAMGIEPREKTVQEQQEEAENIAAITTIALLSGKEPKSFNDPLDPRVVVDGKLIGPRAYRNYPLGRLNRNASLGGILANLSYHEYRVSNRGLKEVVDNQGLERAIELDPNNPFYPHELANNLYSDYKERAKEPALKGEEPTDEEKRLIGDLYERATSLYWVPSDLKKRYEAFADQGDFMLWTLGDQGSARASYLASLRIDSVDKLPELVRKITSAADIPAAALAGLAWTSREDQQEYLPSVIDRLMSIETFSLALACEKIDTISELLIAQKGYPRKPYSSIENLPEWGGMLSSQLLGVYGRPHEVTRYLLPKMHEERTARRNQLVDIRRGNLGQGS